MFLKKAHLFLFLAVAAVTCTAPATIGAQPAGIQTKSQVRPLSPIIEAEPEQVYEAAKKSPAPVFVYFYDKKDPGCDAELKLIQKVAGQWYGLVRLFKVDRSDEYDQGSIVPYPAMVLLKVEPETDGTPPWPTLPNLGKGGGLVILNSTTAKLNSQESLQQFFRQGLDKKPTASAATSRIGLITPDNIAAEIAGCQQPSLVLYYQKGSLLSDVEECIVEASRARFSTRFHYFKVDVTLGGIDAYQQAPTIAIYRGGTQSMSKVQCLDFGHFMDSQRLDEFIEKILGRIDF